MSSAPTFENITEKAIKWLYTNWPNMKKMDMQWTANRYDFPDYVCTYIEDNWVKVNNKNGGTYQKPVLEEEKTFGIKIQESTVYQAMDESNKQATNVMANEGMAAAVKHMFTDQDTGRQLTYGEMRARFG